MVTGTRFLWMWTLCVLALFWAGISHAQGLASAEQEGIPRAPSGVSMEKTAAFGVGASEIAVPLSDGGFVLVRAEKPLKRLYVAERYNASLAKQWSQTFTMEKAQVDRKAEVVVTGSGNLGLSIMPDMEIAHGMKMAVLRALDTHVEFLYSVGRTVYHLQFALETGEMKQSVLGTSPDPKGTAGIVVSEDHSRFSLVFYGDQMRNMGVALFDARGKKIREAVMPVPELSTDKDRGVAALAVDDSGTLHAVLRATDDTLELRSFSAQADSASIRIRSPFPYVGDVLLTSTEHRVAVAAWTGMKKRQVSAVLVSESIKRPVLRCLPKFMIMEFCPNYPREKPRHMYPVPFT